MQKILIVDPEKCTGCRTCETVCSAKHEGVTNPWRSRVNVMKLEWEGVMIPFFCQQCQNAPCVAVCPVNALSHDEEYGRVKIDRDRCIGCRFCMVVCPFGGMGWDPIANKVIKCDFCDGDPTCVRFCSTQAIRFMDASEVKLAKTRALLATISEITKKDLPESLAT